MPRQPQEFRILKSLETRQRHARFWNFEYWKVENRVNVTPALVKNFKTTYRRANDTPVLEF